MSDNAAPFPSLRTAYLRAVARAWRDPGYQKELVAASNSSRRGALDLLEKDYQFKFPFNVKFKVDDTPATRPHWMPVGTTGWFGFADRFDVYLPVKPAHVELEADVLAHYCYHFPSLLGKATSEDAEAPPDFAAFGVITARIVALAWRDEEFRRQLFAAKDARNLVQDAMDYLVPWNFVLNFDEAKKVGPATVDREAYWDEFPMSVIVVNLPLEPEPDVRAVALAAYNDTGAQYPFTCG